MIIPGHLLELPVDREQKVVLNKNERNLAILMGKERYNSNRKNGIENKKAGPQSIYQTEVEGIGGELAFGKALNLYPDFSTVPGKYDFKMSGTTIDVKTTKYENGRLMVGYNKKLSDCDVYVLVVGEMPNYTIVGWLNNHHIINEEHVGDVGTGTVYLADQTELQGFPINIYAKEFQGK